MPCPPSKERVSPSAIDVGGQALYNPRGMYQLEITRFLARPTVEKHASPQASEVWRAIQAVVDEEAVFFVAQIEGNVDYGNFYVWRKRDRAYVRLDEHCEHYASDPGHRGVSGREVHFRDEGGEPLCVPESATVDSTAAMAALEHWLLTGQKLPSLSWD